MDPRCLLLVACRVDSLQLHPRGQLGRASLIRSAEARAPSRLYLPSARMSTMEPRLVDQGSNLLTHCVILASCLHSSVTGNSPLLKVVRSGTGYLFARKLFLALS